MPDDDMTRGSMLRIDAHHHVWDLGVRDQPWTADLPLLRRDFGVEELRRSLHENRIDGTVVVQTVGVAAETPELLQLADADETVAGVVGWVDLTAPGVADRIAALRACPGGERLVGLRHQVQDEPDPRWLCRDDVRAGLAAVAAAGLTYDLLVVPAQLPAAIDTVRALPHLRFVLDHAGKPPIATGELGSWPVDLAALGGCDNVAVKLSGLVTEADPDGWRVEDLRPVTDHLLVTFGADRTMFGSDWPVCLLAASYDEVLTAVEQLTGALSTTERAAVFGGTAVQWYGLAR